MISKNELKYYSGLLGKKFREKEKKFIAEGERIVEEGLKSKFKCEKIIVTHEYFEKKQDYLNNLINDKKILAVIKHQEFKRLSDTVNSQGILAFFEMPQMSNKQQLKSDYIVCLENISDPGNIGTILRNCDWFGINDIVLTEGCAEIYNPKTIRASMGAVFHLNIIDKTDINYIFNLKTKGYRLLTADLTGENIFSFRFPEKLVIVFANEASGPSPALLKISDYLVTIPKYGSAESLNVASAAAVILSRIKDIKN